MHAGAIGKTSTLANIQNVLLRRYGASSGVEDFVRKAQLAHYEDVRAHFEAFAAAGWANHKVTMYWMLNSHWPSFYGNLIDYYLSPGGAYYGAKKGLRPLSVVFDSYAAGDHSQARIIVFNQTPDGVRDLRVRTRVYDLDGKLRDDRSVDGIEVPYNGAKQVSVLPRYPGSSPVYFVRCQLFDRGGKLVVDNVYWQSQKDDDLGARRNDSAMDLRQDSWADMTALNTMPPAAVEVSATRTQAGGTNRVTARVRNPSERIAFFARATVSTAREGNEILPIEYDDNYITVFPGETAEIHAVLPKGAKPGWIKLEGYNTPRISVPLR
jgi:exo-1,4-beta-D-glucosaminidase